MSQSCLELGVRRSNSHGVEFPRDYMKGELDAKWRISHNEILPDIGSTYCCLGISYQGKLSQEI
jgi:hypothetical protein